ncbi:unnamed protein product, partial [Symbiodinium microadriaticum]
ESKLMRELQEEVEDTRLHGRIREAERCWRLNTKLSFRCETGGSQMGSRGTVLWREKLLTEAIEARQHAAEHRQRAKEAELQDLRSPQRFDGQNEANASEFTMIYASPEESKLERELREEVEANQKSRAALAAECQAQLQEQQAMSEIATAVATQEAEASEARQHAAEHQQRAKEAELQESKLARELREEVEAQQKSRAALAAEQQALLQEQRESKLLLERELREEAQERTSCTLESSIARAVWIRITADSSTSCNALGQLCMPSCEPISCRQASEARQHAAEHQQRAKEARQRAAEHQPRAEEDELQESKLLLERQLREEVEAQQKSRAALAAEHQALLQEQRAISAISEQGAAALATQEAEASEARQHAAEHQQRCKEAELQESKLARELREEAEAHQKSRVALAAEQQALLQEQRVSEARQRAAEHQPRAEEDELQESKLARELREEAEAHQKSRAALAAEQQALLQKQRASEARQRAAEHQPRAEDDELQESQNSRAALVAECQALLEEQQAPLQAISSALELYAHSLDDVYLLAGSRALLVLHLMPVAKMEQLSSAPSSQVRSEQIEAEDVLKALSQMTRKLAQQLGEEFVGSTAVCFAWRLHLAEQELKDEMRSALKAQWEVQDQRMQQTAALADKEAEMQRRLAQLERERMESSRKSHSLQVEAEHSVVAAAVGQAEAQFEESMQQLRTEVSLEKSQHAANVSRLKQQLIEAGIEAQIREEDVARMVHFELQHSRQECDSLRRDASATMTAELVAIKEEAAAVARSHAQLLSAKNELQDELLVLQQQSVVDLAATQRSERAAAALRSLVADIRHAEEGAAAREAAAIEELTATRGRFEIQTTELEAAKSDELRGEELLHAAHEVQCMLHNECGALTAHVERAATAESVAQARAAELDEQRQVLRQECQRLRSDNVLLRRQLHGGSPALQDIKIVAAARGRP